MSILSKIIVCFSNITSLDSIHMHLDGTALSGQPPPARMNEYCRAGYRLLLRFADTADLSMRFRFAVTN